jgi:SAM-dependent methyltransferase
MLAAVYDEGALAYQEHWAPMLHRHALDLVTAVTPAVPPGTRTVVDVAAGGGTLLPALQDLAGEGGMVIAVDRSLGMLQQAPVSVPRLQADAAALPLPTGSVDVVVMAFVLFLLPDAGRAIAEAARVLRRGGWLLAATWGKQVGTGADAVVREELDRIGAPEFPALARSDPLTDSAERLSALLGDDFGDIHTWARPFGARFTARSALAMRTGCGALGWRYARLDADRRAVVTERAARRLDALPPEAFIDRSVVLLTTARRG